MKTNRERRVLAWTGEIRAQEAEGGGQTLISTAPPYETLSAPMTMWDGRGQPQVFREQFRRGAFGDLSGADVMATVHHDPSAILGRTPGTLRLEDAKDGLRYEVDLPDTTVGRDLRELVARGDIRGSSFEFSVNEDGEEWSEDGEEWVRTIVDANIYQVGPVTHPAYESGTDVALRSLERVLEARPTPRLARARRRLRLATLTRVASVS